jgi:hypothetical protein
MLLSLFCCMLADWGWEASMRVPSFLVAANVCCNCCGKNPDFGVAGLRAVLLSSSSEFGAVHPLVLHCLGVADVHLLPLLPCFLGSCCCPAAWEGEMLVGWVEDFGEENVQNWSSCTCCPRAALGKNCVYGNELHGCKFNINALNVFHVHVQEIYIYIYSRSLSLGLFP